ncbi:MULTISPECIES: class I SAM-dependent methyltransferase [unclassified Mesorhizobium]|uniref:class I SAM-dependent methyltransferase n=1 Tax=unclassified Mesorhizobium TaxID=325217 RepID=UPI003334CA11
MSTQTSQVEWEGAYLSGNCAWDTRMPTPELLSRLQDLNLGASRILEIGCGTGANAIAMAQQGHEVTAIDFVESAIGVARSAAADAGVYVEFEVADAFGYANDSRRFDVVFDSGVYHSSRRTSLRKYMELVWSALRPGGLLITFVGNPEDGQIFGPKRVSAYDLLREHQPFFELIDLRRFLFESTAEEMRPLGWSAVFQKRFESLGVSDVLLNALPNSVRIGGKGAPLSPRLEELLRTFSIASHYPWQMRMEALFASRDAADLSILYSAPDRVTGQKRNVHYVRTDAFKSAASNEELADVILTNLVVVAVHELLENIYVDGKRTFDPHSTARFLDTRYAEILTLSQSGVTR